MQRIGAWLSAIVCLLSLACSPGFAADPSSVPILLYHRLGPVTPAEMTVTPPVFQGLLPLIQERGRTEQRRGGLQGRSRRWL